MNSFAKKQEKVSIYLQKLKLKPKRKQFYDFSSNLNGF